MLWPLVPFFCLPMETLNLSETLDLDPNNWWIYHPPTSPNATKESNHVPNLNHFCKDSLFTRKLHVQTFGWICPKTKEFLDQFCTQNLSCWPQRMLSSPPLVTGMLHNETWNKQMHLSFMSTCINFGIMIKLFHYFFTNSTLSAWWFCCFRLLNIEVYAGCGCVSSWWSCGRARGTRCQKPRPPKCMVTDWSKIFHLVDIPKKTIKHQLFISKNQLEIHQLDRFPWLKSPIGLRCFEIIIKQSSFSSFLSEVGCHPGWIAWALEA